MADESLAAGALFPAIPRGWKFLDTTTAELSRRLVEAGPGAKLSILSYVKGDLLLLKLRVIRADGTLVAEASADLNDSFPCPPFVTCSGGGGG